MQRLIAALVVLQLVLVSAIKEIKDAPIKTVQDTNDTLAMWADESAHSWSFAGLDIQERASPSDRASSSKLITLNGWNMLGTEDSCDRYTQLNESQCWQKCEQSAQCELVTFGVGRKAGFCCLHQMNENTNNVRPQQSKNWKLIYEEQPGLHRVDGQVFWGEKIRRFDVDQEEVCSLACTYNIRCNVAAYKKAKNVCFLMYNMEVPRNVWDAEYVTFYTEQQLKL